MRQEKETFQISVEINHGLEPLTLGVTLIEKTSPDKEQEVSFEITRDQNTLGVLIPDPEHGWKLAKGEINQDEVDLIGAAIDGHYA